MFGEERSHVLARTIGRIAGVVDFALRGVDESHTGRTVEEALDFGLSFGRIKRGPAFIRIRLSLESFKLEELTSIFPGAEAHVVTPEELKSHGFGAFVLTFSIAFTGFPFGFRAIFEEFESGVDLSCSDGTYG